MAIPQLKESCCGCSLQTGSKVIAWFHVVCSVIGLIIFCIALSAGRIIRVQTADRVYLVENYLYNYYIFYTICTVASVIVAICLMVGAYKSSAGPVLTWVIYNTIGTIVYLVLTLYIGGTLLTVSYIGLLYLVIGLLIAALQIYLLLVVFSFYRELKHDPQNIATYNTG